MINNGKINNFFNEVVEDVGFYDDLFIVLVTHLVQDREYFIESLSKIAEVGLIIPKPNSIVEPIEEKLSNKYRIFKVKRNEIEKNPTLTLDKIDSLRNGKKVLILDIGGYFSKVVKFCKGKFGNKFVGIIEDTENGMQKYLTSKEYNEATIFSVARSSLKNAEDFLVGSSICFSAESVIRNANEIFTSKKALVLGYGKVGYSIARHLSERNMSVYVYDMNYIRLLEAKSHGYNTLTRKESLKIADLIFCATGNKSIIENDIFFLKDECIIFTSTSSDDEISLPNGILEYERLEKNFQHITSLTTKEGNRYHLCNSGNAVNFLHGASVGQFIFVIQSEILYTIKSIMKLNGEVGKIFENNEKDRGKLASIWLKYFN